MVSCVVRQSTLNEIIRISCFNFCFSKISSLILSWPENNLPVKKKKKYLLYRFILSCILLFFTAGCKEDTEISVTTDIITDITLTSATCIGTIHSGSVHFCGFTWSKLPALPENQSLSNFPDGYGVKDFTGKFSVGLDGLESGTTYYVRAFAIDYTLGTSGSNRVIYGNVISFTTK